MESILLLQRNNEWAVINEVGKMELYRGCAGAVIRVLDVKEASTWLCENLFFERIVTENDQNCQVLVNGNCVLYLIPAGGFPGSVLPDQMEKEKTVEAYATGLDHIALHAAEIHEALRWCKGKNLDLVLDGDGSFYNPGVFGEGEWYFNILTPFGVTFEISEQVSNPVKQEGRPINGLDHLGIPCENIWQELRFLEDLGFQPLFEPVYNYNEAEGHITCVMVSDKAVTLEVYQFMDKNPCVMGMDKALAGIAYEGVSVDSPGGVHFIGKLKETEVRYE